MTEVGKLMIVSSVYSVFDKGNPLPESAYSAFYFDTGTNTVLSDNNTLTDSPSEAKNQAVDRSGGVPNIAGNYAIVVVEGKVDASNFTGNTTFSKFEKALKGASYHVQPFTVKATTKDFGEVSVFEYSATASDNGLSDAEVTYNGGALTLGLAMGGKALKAADISNTGQSIVSAPAGVDELVVSNDGEIVTIKPGIDGSPGSPDVTPAGDYVIELKGAGAYNGKTVQVRFSVGKLDISQVVLSAEPLDNTGNVSSTTEIKADGTIINSTAVTNLVTVSINAFDGEKGENGTNGTETGTYTLKVEPKVGNANVTGGAQLVEVVKANNKVSYLYSGNAFPAEFVPAYNFGFNPGNITAQYGSPTATVVPFTCKVTKDGVEVTSYDEPGEYLLELTTAPDNAYTYAGHEVIEFTVAGEVVDYSDAVAYYAVDGKEVPAAGVEYTGSAIVPSVAVVYDGESLVAGEDYTVSYEDSEGNAVESIVEPGIYSIVVTMNDDQKHELTPKTLIVNKASIESAQADASFYQVGQAPSFTGSTELSFDRGLKFALPTADVSVIYYAAEQVADTNDIDGDGNETEKVWVKKADAKATDQVDLEAGDYVADIQVKTTCATLKGGVAAYDKTTMDGFTDANKYANVHVKVAEQVVFADVSADAWYADAVYLASQSEPVKYEYMSGIPGTNLFLPEATITRAETAQVLFNMAGGEDDLTDSTYPTSFADVPADAWYAQAVLWASNARIISGYDKATFGPSDNVTREQAATMLYRYMQAQGKADAAIGDLTAYADGVSVSSWATEAMQWAVEAGVFGVDTDVLRPQDNLTRAEMATIAVRVQPDGAIQEL